MPVAEATPKIMENKATFVYVLNARCVKIKYGLIAVYTATNFLSWVS